MDQVPAEDGGQEPQQSAEQSQDVRAGQGGGDCPAQQHLPQHLIAVDRPELKREVYSKIIITMNVVKNVL